MQTDLVATEERDEAIFASLRKEEPTPMSLMEMALQNPHVSPEHLNQLMDLQAKWMKIRALEAFNNAMTDAQEQMRPVVANAKNPQTNSFYADLFAVHKAIVPVYTRCGLSLSFSEEASTQAEHMRIVCRVSHRMGHTEAYHLDLPLDGKGIKGQQMMTNLHAKASTVSYGQRYLCKMIFNLAVGGEDDDGNGPSEYIGPGQIGEINDLLKACRDAGREVDMVRFREWAEITNIEDITTRAFPKVIDYLKRKRSSK
jgi:hypothetical protein